MGIKAITFDVGSTLLFPDPPEDVVMQRALASLGHDVVLESITPYIETMYVEVYENELKTHPDFWADDDTSRDLWYAMYRWLATQLGFADIKEELATFVYQAYLSADNWSLYDEVIPALEALKARGIRMAVISNWDGNLPQLLQDIDIAKYFDTITTSALVNLRKPDPRIFALTLDNLSLKPFEIMHVGDNVEADGFGAREAGVETIIIDRERRYTGSDFKSIQSLLELVALI